MLTSLSLNSWAAQWQHSSSYFGEGRGFPGQAAVTLENASLNLLDTDIRLVFGSLMIVQRNKANSVNRQEQYVPNEANQ
jgi:hypothetical protein